MFPPALNDIKSAVLNCFNFRLLFFKMPFSLNQNKISWFFPDLKELFSRHLPSLWQTCIWFFFILVFCQAKRADNLGLIRIIKAKKNTIPTFNNEYYLQSQYFFFWITTLISVVQLHMKRFLNLINDFYLHNEHVRTNQINVCPICRKSTLTVREKIENVFFSFHFYQQIMTTQDYCILTEFAASLSIGGKNTKR